MINCITCKKGELQEAIEKAIGVAKIMKIMELLKKHINDYFTYANFNDLKKIAFSSVCRPQVNVFTKPLLYLANTFNGKKVYKQIKQKCFLCHN